VYHDLAALDKVQIAAIIKTKAVTERVGEGRPPGKGGRRLQASLGNISPKFTPELTIETGLVGARK